MATVTDTGRTVRELRGGEWVDVPVRIRDGHYCLCGDQHGQLPWCVGSAWRASEDGKSATQPNRPARRNRRKADHPQAKVAQEFFAFPKRRLPRAIPQTTIDACADCGPEHEAFYYCEAHRSQAVRNTILAARKNPGIISLHMMMAEKGLDIVS